MEIALLCNRNFPWHNNYSDYAFVTFIKQTTPVAFLVHLETTVCSKKLSSQSIESLLAVRGIEVVEKEYKLFVWMLISEKKVY